MYQRLNLFKILQAREQIKFNSIQQGKMNTLVKILEQHKMSEGKFMDIVRR